MKSDQLKKTLNDTTTITYTKIINFTIITLHILHWFKLHCSYVTLPYKHPNTRIRLLVNFKICKHSIKLLIFLITTKMTNEVKVALDA